ncbi:MAG: hypothetical protein FWC95_06275 [Defluviitaleaceae bacterium]|nr:hypothetical protein [Defluviitaleaceae bacterium]
MIAEGGIIFALILILSCAAPMWIVAVWAFRRKTPMHFWAGSTVKAEEISDVHAYNREHGFMWLSYGSAFAISGIVGLFDVMAGSAFTLIISTFGLIPLFINYRRIWNKYKVEG